VIILDKFGDGRQNGNREAGFQEQGALGVIVRPGRRSRQAICDLNFRPFPAFLSGSGQNVECDVTYSKQTTAPFLPGATTPQFGSRIFSRGAHGGAHSASRMQLTHTFRVNPEGIHPERICEGRNSAFLTGSASQTELAVTHSKQTTGTFLTGSRTAIRNSQKWAAIKENF
jgi:hypothetical protein